MLTSAYRTTAIGVSVLLVSVSLSLGFLFSEEVSLMPFVQGDDADRSEYVSGWYDQDFYQAAYEAGGVGGHVDAGSAIMAHHYLVADKIAEVFEAVGSSKIDTVILLSPNHFAVDVSPAQVSFGVWETPFGRLEVDQSLAEELVEYVGVMEHEELVFEGEHGVSLITPFIVKSFPNANFIPIVLHDSLTQEEAEEIGTAISELAPKSFVIASIDMSHLLPDHAASFHDEVTLRAIETGGGNVDLEVDANRVLDVLFAFNEATGSQEWNLTHHGSSIQMGVTDDAEENTSHILGYFTEGNPIVDPFASMHFVGDMMLDRGVRLAIHAEDDPSYPWKDVERFLEGVHLRIGNLEGTVNELESTYTNDPPFRFVFDPSFVEAMLPYIDAVSLANNHSSDVGSAGELETQVWLDEIGMDWFGGYDEPVPRFDTSINGIDVSFIGYHAFQPDADALEEQIRAADASGAFVVVLPHWGTEYAFEQSSYQREIAQFMVDAGADLIIGSHPHVPQGIEVIDGVPVVYSLGNFIFDQEVPETWEALTIGLILDNDDVTLHVLPVETKSGQPTPLSDANAEDLLELIAAYSDESLQSSIQQGTITIPRL